MEPITQTLEEVKEELAAATKIPDVKEEEKPREISRKELGQIRKHYYTVQHPEVTACGHKIDLGKPPVRNCEECWYAYFKTSANLEEIRTVMGVGGISGLTARFGIKFAKAFRDFLHFELTIPAPPEEGLHVPTDAAELRAE